LSRVGGPLQLEVELTLEPGAIQDRAAQLVSKGSRQHLNGRSVPRQLTFSDAQAAEVTVRLLELNSTLFRTQSIDGLFSRLAMKLELETIRQQRLKLWPHLPLHAFELLGSDPGWIAGIIFPAG
jgi:hypothetical protein